MNKFNTIYHLIIHKSNTLLVYHFYVQGHMLLVDLLEISMLQFLHSNMTDLHPSLDH
jgi:hypothetical protein